MSRSEWLVVLLLAAANFTNFVDFVIIMPLGEQLMSELGIGTDEFGMIVSTYGWTASIALVLSGLIVERFDRRTVFLSAYACFGIATLLCGLAPDYWSLIATRALAGACGGIASSAMMAIIADVFPDARLGRAIGMVTSAFAVASVVGLPLGLTLATEFGRGVPFLAVAALSVPIWLAAFWKLPSLTAHPLVKAGNPLVELWAAAKHPPHWRSYAFMFTLVMGSFTVIPFLAPYLELNCGLTKQNIAILYAISGAITLVSMNVVGVLTDRIGKLPVFLVLATASMMMTLVMTNLPPVALLFAVAVAAGFMVAASGRFVPAQAMMLANAVPAMRGRFSSLNSAVQHFATGVAASIAGHIVTRPDPTGPLQGYALDGLIAISFAAVALGISFTLRIPLRNDRVSG